MPPNKFDLIDDTCCSAKVFACSTGSGAGSGAGSFGAVFATGGGSGAESGAGSVLLPGASLGGFDSPLATRPAIDWPVFPTTGPRSPGVGRLSLITTAGAAGGDPLTRCCLRKEPTVSWAFLSDYSLDVSVGISTPMSSSTGDTRGSGGGGGGASGGGGGGGVFVSGSATDAC